MAKSKPKVVYNTQPRIRLEPYRGSKSRIDCPSCGSKKTFARFIDITSGLHLGDQFGRCNREEKCGYNLSPTGEDFKDKTLMVSSNDIMEKFRDKDITNLMNPKFVNRSLNEREDNFLTFLYNKFKRQAVEQIIKRYKVGSMEMWAQNATVFWQIDQNFDVRTGKIMLYNPNTGKRVKQPFNHITWAHTPYKDNDFGGSPDYCLTQCFFGEHLLNEETVQEFNVVESEKTAIICSIVKPNTYWIATGGLQNINEQRMLPFKGKKLTFYPDKGKAYTEWQKKLKPFMNNPEYDITVSDSVEKMTSLQVGDDIGDLIINKLAQNK